MSIACFCSSLYCSKMMAEAGGIWSTCHVLFDRLLSRRLRAAAAPTNSSVSPSHKAVDDEIDVNLSPFLITYKSGRFERLGRFDRAGYVPASLDPITGVNSKDVLINPDTKVSVRIYLPKVKGSPPEKLPVLIYFHGGAFIVEDTASPPYHNYLNRLAAKADILIVSVNYRLAPEHRLPAAYDDCMEALKWVVSHSAGTGQEDWIADHGDFSHLFLSGDSAGANIAHNVAMQVDESVNIEGIALVHPYFFGSVPVGKEIDDHTNLSLHKKLWPFIAPEDSEGMDDPRVNSLGPTARSLDELKCQRAVVFLAGDDFHADRGRMYYDKLVESKFVKASKCCVHDGLGHVFHLDESENESEENESEMVEATKKKKEEANELMMKQLVDFYRPK